jgi:RNA polymerase-binding protein DksA
MAHRVHGSGFMRKTLIRQLLMKQRSQLLARYRDELERVDEQLDSHEAEVVERATEQWDAQVLANLGESDARALAQIVAAVRRLDAGSYGECTSCGTKISPARLAAVPWAELCIGCAAEQQPKPRAEVLRAG